MVLYFVLFTLGLALAAAGCIHARRQDHRITITIEFGIVWGWFQAIWECGKEFVASTRFSSNRAAKADPVAARRHEEAQSRRWHLNDCLDDEDDDEDYSTTVAGVDSARPWPERIQQESMK